MPLNPDIAEQQRMAEASARRRTGVARRERLAEILFGTGVLTAIAVLVVAARPPLSGVELLPAVVCVVCFAIAVHVPFAVGDGYTVPTQLAFVPMLFSMPPAFAPLAVIVALLLARAPKALLGQSPPSRLLLIPGDACFAVGPAAALAAAGVGVPAEITLPLLALALAAQIAAETLGWVIHDRAFGLSALRAQLGEFWVHGVDLALSPVAFVAALSVREQPWTVLALLPLVGVLAVFSREREARLEGLVELNQAYRGTALVLGDVVEADDGYTGEHSRGVVSLALAIGDALGLDPVQRRNLEFGALLHDVGKVAIPKEIINKPGKLDPAEWTIIKTHTVEGQRMLDRVGGFMRNVGLIVRSHHERWDGDGYPDGLVGDAIPLEARIISCCDAWNAMTTTRSYRAAMPLEAAVAEMRANSGAQFDPRVVELLLAIVPHDASAAGRPAALAA
jgi:putative nucleotidyltransferase with HDIG domain